jgi:hypothetical protein
MTGAAPDPQEQVEYLLERPAPHYTELDPYRPDRIRGQLSYALCGLLSVTIAFIALQVLRGYWDSTREFAEISLPGELAVLGSAVTFYFTTRQD